MGALMVTPSTRSIRGCPGIRLLRCHRVSTLGSDLSRCDWRRFPGQRAGLIEAHRPQPVPPRSGAGLMDGKAFDAIARQHAWAGSRRGFARGGMGLLAALGAVLLTGLGDATPEAEAHN